MKRMIQSKTPWLAALWLCCGTGVVSADDTVAQDEDTQTKSVQKIIREVIKDVKNVDGDASVSVNVERVIVKDGDGEPQEKGKIVIKTGDGKTQVFDLSEAVKKGGHRVIRLDGNKLKEMDLDIDIEDMKFDLMKDGAAFRFRAGDATAAASDFMIGVHCETVGGAVRAHVDVPENALMVSEVTEDGPAAKAGMKQYDIITTVGDKPVKSLEGLVKSIQDSKGEEFTVTVMRKGDEAQLTLKPTKRQQSAEISKILKSNLHKHLGEGMEHSFTFDVDTLGAGKNIRIETMRPGIVLEASDDIEEIMERLPKLMMGRKGAKNMDIRVIRNGGRESSGKSTVRSVVRVQDDHDHDDADGPDSEHEHGDDEDDDGHHDGDDDDEHHHADDNHESHNKLAKRVDELSKEIERLKKSLKKLKSKRD